MADLEVSEPVCYCNSVCIEEDTPFLKCQVCEKKFHIDCLKTGTPSSMVGDVFFNFTCSNCAEDGQEDVKRMKMQWTQVVYLALYNLQTLGQSGKRGYYRWKEHICAYIDRHWNTLFGSHRKKTTLWHGTVAGTLSSGCPHHFTSGANELGETGWWKLTTMKPPYVKKVTTPPVSTPKSNRRRVPVLGTTVKVEGLRSRRGKTSIESAMELKAKRETLLEAKEMRRSKSSTPGVSPVQSEASDSCSQFTTGQTYIKQEPDFITVNQEPSDSLDNSSSLNLSANRSFVSIASSGSTSHRSLVESFREVDEDSQFSYASSTRTDSWLTEQELRPDASLPSMLMSDDQDIESESDFEIDPGTITPPSASPVQREESPTLQDILSTVSSTDDISNSQNSDTAYRYMIHHTDSSSTPAQFPQSDVMEEQFLLQVNIKKEPEEQLPQQQDIRTDPEEEASVVDSESESDSNEEEEEEAEEQPGMSSQSWTQPVQRKRRRVGQRDEDRKENVEPPPPRLHLMSLYEERQLLKKMNMAADAGPLPPELHRLRRKLIVRQQQRERGLPVFDADAQMNQLMQKFWGDSWENEENKEYNPKGIPTSNLSSGETRVLDRFQVAPLVSHTVMLQQPSFLNRLIGTDDDQLTSIRSPYTSRMLKPFIRRDFESRPLKMRLLEEIKAYPHRDKCDWKPAPPPSIDYCYIRPQHIPSLNTLCREFFWPGIDLSECLQYPDFSCVVLFRKIVIGFSFMVPDVKFNEAYISFIFTHPEWRRAGIAKFMLYHLIQTCMGKDVTLHVSATNSAMLMYQKFGFKPEEFILDFYDKYYSEDSKECKHAFFLRLRR